MSQNVYLVSNFNTSDIADNICNQIFINRKFISEDLQLTEELLYKMANSCLTENFYVIIAYRYSNISSVDFSFTPENWDNEYVHIWNNDKSIRIFNRDSVLKDPSMYTDQTLAEGKCKLKNLSGPQIIYYPYEIIFLSYDESHADENYKNLCKRFPNAIKMKKVKGIYEAHKHAAKVAKMRNSSMFYIVDADAVILPKFNFDYSPDIHDVGTVHVWTSINPINDLKYGYGGVKLFPTNLLLNYQGSPIDFSTSVSKNFKIMDEVSNITKFNTDEFSTWRSGFRECTKLSAGLINNQNSVETQHRLDSWCNLGIDREFGEFSINGSRAGRDFGSKYANQPEMLKLINDYDWLKGQFKSQQ